MTKNYLFLYLHLFHSFLLFFFFRNCWCNSSGVPVILFSLSITLGRHVFIWFLHCSNFPWEVFFIPVPLSSLSFICIKFVNSMICIATFSDEPVSNDISFSLEKVFFLLNELTNGAEKKLCIIWFHSFIDEFNFFSCTKIMNNYTVIHT